MTVREGFLTCLDGDGAIFEELAGLEAVRLWRGDMEGGATTSTTYGVVMEGSAEISVDGSRHSLSKGCFFSAPGRYAIRGGRGVLIEVPDYRGLMTVGGPVETAGRLRYIDGCTDTLLIPPVRWGDPCMNALYFPPSVQQTPHTHPSVRFGAVMWGRGYCETGQGTFTLEPGLVFCIPTDLVHSFHTRDEQLAIVTYHPDSDFGPQDENHPMVNRTLVNGVSASRLPEVQTA